MNRNSREYQQCTRCIMDTSDPLITFSAKGECSHCQNFDNVLSKNWFPNNEGKKIFDEVISRIKENGKGKDYDCIIGLSGGLDSSYLAYIASQQDLRILAVHVDAGWNSELAVQNIENIVKKCNLDLFTHVVDWGEMQDLHYAFFKAQVPNQDIPQDHAFFAALYSFATKHNVEYVLHGSNISTESVLPTAWGYNAMDSRHIKEIHKLYGRRKLNEYPFVSFFQLNFYFPYIKKMKVAKLLNYLPYTVEEAIDELEKKVDYKYYGGKHYESRFTKFFQAHFLPLRFGYNKKLAHLSALILSGQKTRDEALLEFNKPIYDDVTLAEDRTYFIKKLGMTEDEYFDIVNGPIFNHDQYKSNKWFFEKYHTIAKEYKSYIPKWLRTTV